MLVLKLLQASCPETIPVTILDKLGDGADGEVFSFKEDPGKVIKFCVLYEMDKDIHLMHEQVSKALDYLIKSPCPAYARVYEHKYVYQWERQTYNDIPQRCLVYYYVMEKLQKISDDETKVFHSILSHEDRGIKKDYPDPKIKKMLSGLSRGLDFDEKKITLFLTNLKKSPVSHLDIHVRNIMKDKSGNFKMIDLDRIQLNYGE